jgi:hypothetical protein
VPAARLHAAHPLLAARPAAVVLNVRDDLLTAGQDSPIG